VFFSSVRNSLILAAGASIIVVLLRRFSADRA
jgi:hypothetical protein